MRPRIGVVGAGVWGRHHLNAAVQLEERGTVELAAMAAHSRETVDGITGEYDIPGYTDYQKMIKQEDVDAVTIATPDHLHKEMTIFAAESNKHVLVEKPMDLSVEGCKEMINAAENNEVLLEVDFHKRFDPYVSKLREVIQDGEIGEVLYVYAYMEDKLDIPAGTSWAANSSPFWFLGVHKVDLLRYVLGSEVERVYAKGHEGKLQKLGIDTFDAINALLEFESGASASIDVCWVLPDSFESVVNQGVRIIGTEGMAEIDTQDRGFRIWKDERPETYNLFAHRSRTAPSGVEKEAGYYVDGVIDFYERVALLNSGEELNQVKQVDYPSGYDGMEATKAAAAVENSLKTREFVSLDD